MDTRGPFVMGVADDVTLQFYLAYRSLCPGAWIQRWDDQRGMLAFGGVLNRNETNR